MQIVVRPPITDGGCSRRRVRLYSAVCRLRVLLLLPTAWDCFLRDLPSRCQAVQLSGGTSVSVRTVYRDVEALSAAGIPVYAERGWYGGVRLLPGFRTDMTVLTRDEARALFVLVGQSAHSALGLDRALGSALRKMTAALPARHRSAAELTSRRLLIDPDRLARRAARPDRAGRTAPRRPHRPAAADRLPAQRPRHRRRLLRRSVRPRPQGRHAVPRRRPGGAPRLFRADRLRGVAVTTEPVRHRNGVELVEVWKELRQEVESRGGGVVVRARVRRHRLDMLRRITRPYFLGATGEGRVDAEELTSGGEPTARGGPTGEPVRTADGGDGGGGGGGGDGGDDDGCDGTAADETWLTVELEYPVPASVCQLLQLGTDVEVLGPPRGRPGDLPCRRSSRRALLPHRLKTPRRRVDVLPQGQSARRR